MYISTILNITYSIPDVFINVQICDPCLLFLVTACVFKHLNIYLCKYLSNYFLLNHFTHPHLESNNTYPYLFHFRCTCLALGSDACPLLTLVRHISTVFVLLCKYLSNYFLLNHLTHPHLESNLVLTLSYSISDVLVSR